MLTGNLLENAELLRSLLDNLREGVYFTDLDRRVLYWSKGAERISGFPAAEVVGRRCSDNILTHVDQEGCALCAGECSLKAAMEDGEPRDSEIFLHHKNGHRLPVHVSVSPIRDAEGHIMGGLETFTDSSSAMAALDEIERLRELSLICPLTGVGNRRYTQQTLAHKLDEMKRNDSWLAVLFVDIDHFKQFNDKHGHAVGDLVLVMVAKALASGLRSYDFLGRWGGEEFVAVLPNIKPTDLESTAERLRMLVESSSRDSSDGKLCVTVSIGAYLCKEDDTSEGIVTHADALMYQSKENGRNCVTIG